MFLLRAQTSMDTAVGAIIGRVTKLSKRKCGLGCHVTSAECCCDNSILWGRSFWKKTCSAVGELRRKGPRLFSTWENAGIYSLGALAIQPDASVHAFEPTLEIAARLRATAKLNGLDHPYVHEAAVFSKNGQAILKRFRGELGTNEGMNFIWFWTRICRNVRFARV